MQEDRIKEPIKVTDLQYFVNPILSKWKVAVCVLIIILGLTFIRGYRARKFYEVSFFVTCNYPFSVEINMEKDVLKNKTEPTFNQAEMKTLAGNFQSLVSSSQPALKQLSLNTSRIVHENNSSEMILDVYDSAQIANIVTGFVNYLNHNQFLVKKLEQDRNHFDRLIKEIDSQLHMMQNTLKSSETDVKVKEAYLELITKRETTLSKLENLKGFEVSVPPVRPDQYANMSLSKQMILALVWGSILSLFIAFFAVIIQPAKR